MVLRRKDREQARLVHLHYKKAQRTGLSVTAVFHLSARAFSLHPTEFSNVAPLISVSNAGGFTGQILHYSRSNHLWHEWGRKKNAFLSVCLRSVDTQLLLQPVGKHAWLRLSTPVLLYLTAQVLVLGLFFFLIVTCDCAKVLVWLFFNCSFRSSRLLLRINNQTVLVSAALCAFAPEYGHAEEGTSSAEKICELQTFVNNRVVRKSED